ncbi:Guanine nucleotide-binding protein G(o) subunit alpha [Kappamyces sp. JEL0829]|nr:Guanine nucleotide-binding protein G(o) subunit alpha [Kappamyces sp. JEL0829]
MAEEAQLAAKRAKEVETYLAQERKEWTKSQKEPRLLLLGTSDSGKSTLLKQMKILHAKGFSEQEKKLSAQAIRAGILSSIRKIFGKVPNKSPEFLEVVLRAHSQKYASVADIEDTDPSNYVELAPLCAELWAEECVKQTFQQLPQNLVPDTIEHFLDSIQRIAADSYEPTDEDVLKLRTVTQNISETIFSIQGKNFHFFDVSGLKYHRKYWLPYFENVTSILFVVALSSYNQLMMEEGNTNRMTDALFVWKQIVNHPTLSRPSIILFLNKMDLFEKRVKVTGIKEFFPDYDGTTRRLTTGKPNSVSGGLTYFDAKFKALVDNKEKMILTHCTCATDTKAMQFIISGML